jgi:predicted aminopeptidase
MLRVIALLPILVFLHGCYYVQAAAGQWELMRKRQPIDEVLAADDTPEQLAARLRLVQQARAFSISELDLPDNDSYRSYADIEREYVVWNVFAAPEFSLQAKTWCFPVAGCVGYRGYFAEDDAEREALRLSDKGYDVAIGGVAAYSTLGKFDDPVLNTMLQWDDTRLVGVIFHELAHQELYVKGDTAFNESFASAVQETGVERWLAAQDNVEGVARYRQSEALGEQLMTLVAGARADLEVVYASGSSETSMRQQKAERLQQLAADMRAAIQDAGREPAAWLTGDLNNARLVSMSLYETYLPAFRNLLGQCDGELACFYREARRVAKLDKPERDRELEALASSEAL